MKNHGLVTLAGVFAAIVAVGTQQDPARFKTEAAIVRVDVYPVTADGQAVTDLAAGDFEVREDNAPQTIATFERVTIQPSTQTVAEPTSLPASRALATGERARILVVFLDTAHTDAGAARAIYRPLVRLLDDAMGPDDVIAVMTPEMSARDLTFSRKASSIEPALSRFHEYAQRDTTRRRDPDEERYEACFPEHSARLCRDPTDPTGQRMIESVNRYAGVAREMIARRREQRVMAALGDLVHTLEGLNSGRKAVLTVSSGWLLYRESRSLTRLSACDGPPPPGRLGTGPAGRLTTEKDKAQAGLDMTDMTICEADRRKLAELDVQYEFRRVMDAANRANVSFYPIDARGLTAIDNMGATPTESVSTDTARVGDRVAALRTLADNTDGLAVVNTNDLAGGVTRLLSDLTSYYLLGYYSTNNTADGGYRRISVSVKRRGVKVRARRGYRAMTAGELERQLTEAAQAGQTLGGGVNAVQAAILALAELPAASPVRSRVAYGAVSADRLRMWAVTEIATSVAREGAWMGGGAVDVALTGSDNTALAATEGALAGGQRAVRLDLGEIERPESPTTVRLRLRPSGDGARLQDVLTLAPVGDASPGVPLMSRRGPTTGSLYVPTADPRFRRTERVRLELPLPAPPSSLTATLLDRAGAPIAVPVATTIRGDDGLTWAVADLAFAPLAHGDYVVKLSVDGKDVITAIRVVP